MQHYDEYQVKGCRGLPYPGVNARQGRQNEGEKEMGIDTERIVEAVKRVKPLFMDRERSAQITEKGLADYVTQVDIRVQEQVRQ